MENTLFKDMEISKEIKKAIADMGFEVATPIQEQAIPCMLEGKDVIGLAQTGTGKTCAFGIPAVEMVDTKSNLVQTIILAPTRELVIQMSEELKHLVKYKEKVRIVPIYGGQPIERQIMALKKKPQIIIGTPGRLMDHMRRKTIKLDNISLLVLDEADEMLNMGFREDLDVILENAPVERQTVLFSATMSKDIMRITKNYQKEDAVTVKIEHKTLTVPQIEQYYVEVYENKKVDVLTRILDALDSKLSVVFCNTKKKVDEVTSMMQARGYLVEALHGDMKQVQRDNVMKRFRSGKIHMLVATDVAARGIDVDDIDIVFNYDIPSDEEYYVHRIGRTGRAGRTGTSITFVSGKELYKLRDIQRYTKAKMTTYTIPSAKSINEIKIKNLMEKVKNEVEAGKLNKYIESIEEFINEDQVLTTMDIAAALVKMQIGGFETDDLTVEKKSKKVEGTIRVFINLGKLDKMSGFKLRDLVIENAGVSNADISDVKILEKFSFFNVKAELIDDVINSLNIIEYNNRRVSAEISSSKPNGGSSRTSRNSVPKTKSQPKSRSNGGYSKSGFKPSGIKRRSNEEKKRR